MREFKGKSIIALPTDYVVIDIETTGLSPEFDDIIELAALRVRDDKIIDRFQSFVFPGRAVSDFISQLTGITNAMLSRAPALADVLPEYLSFIGDDVVVGHNVGGFDVNFIYDKAELVGADHFSNEHIDTLRIFRKLFPDKVQHRLEDMVAELSVDTAQFHRAEADCMSTYASYLKLKAIALQKYSSPECFSKAFVHQGTPIDLNNIVPQTDSIDETHPLYGMNCAFTGTLEKMKRSDAMQLVVNFGGKPQSVLNKETNYLIVGNFDYNSKLKGEKSEKLVRAENMQLKGMDIHIIPENTFYDMIEQ